MTEDLLLAALFLVGAVLTWRNPLTHFPQQYRRIREGYPAGTYMVFPIVSAICLVGVIFFLVRAF